METIKIKNSRGKSIFFFVILFFFFVVFSIVPILFFSNYSVIYAKGGIVAVLFGVALLAFPAFFGYFAFNMLRDALSPNDKIILDENGVTPIDYKTGCILWKDIEEVYLFSLNNNTPNVALKIPNINKYFTGKGNRMRKWFSYQGGLLIVTSRALECSPEELGQLVLLYFNNYGKLNV